MEENKSLGSVINQIDNFKSCKEYLSFRVLPGDTRRHYKVLDEEHKSMMNTIIAFSILKALFRKEEDILNTPLHELKCTVSSDEFDYICEKLINTISNYVFIIARCEYSLCDEHNLYNHDAFIRFLDMNNISYFTQTSKDNDKNNIDRNIIINVGENNILELKESLSEDNTIKLSNIDLKLLNYDEYLKLQSDIDYYTEIEVHKGDPL